VALLQYLTYRYRLDPDGLVITSGLLQRTRRDIPYERVHNIVLHQRLLHRWCGVAEVRLESAGGGTAEAEMRVLSLFDAQAIEARIRARGLAARPTADTESASASVPAPATTLLVLPPAEVVRLGLISNRGMVLVAAAVGALWQVWPDDASPETGIRWVYAFVSRESGHLLPAWLLAPMGLTLAAGVLVVGGLVVVRVLSVTLALLQFHGFTLTDVGRQLRVDRGLLTRVRLYVPRRRLQAWRITETLIHRWFGRQSLRVDNAGGDAGERGSGARDLAPVATPAALSGLIRYLMPGTTWPPETWRPIHPRAWRRLVFVPAMLVAIVTVALTWRYGGAGLLALGTIPVLVLRARGWARRTSYAEMDGGVIAVREGWLSRSWRFVEVHKLQSLRLTESPFDRRHGMATLWLDTAGATSREGILRIPFLPLTDARALYDRLAAGMDQ
jgi:putative membrane protein